jgi:MFS family permease
LGEDMTELKDCLGEGSIQSSKEKNDEHSQKGLINWSSNLKKAYLVHFLMGFHMISGILIPFFLQWGGLNFIQVMLIQSYFTIMILIFEIPCGAIADYLSRKLSLILGTAITGLAAYVYSTYPNIIIFLLGETLWALGGALVSGTDQAFIYDTLKKMGKQNEISKYMARVRSFTLLAIGISAPIGSLIGYAVSLPLVMRLMAIPMLVATLTGLTLKEPKKGVLVQKKENYLQILKTGMFEIVKNKKLQILAFDQIIIESMIFFIIWTYQLYLEILNFQIVYFGFVSASLTAIQIIFNNIIPKLEQQFTNKRSFIQIYTIIPGIGFIFMAIVKWIPLSIALILLVIGTGFSRSIIFTNGINKQIQTGNRATVFSTISMMASILRTILYPLVGFLTMIDLGFTFILLGVILIISAIFSRIRNDLF